MKKILKKTKTKNKEVAPRIRTEKEKKLFKLILDNFGKTGKARTMYELMIEAGYSHNTAHEQSRILNKIKSTKEYTNYVERLEKHRETVIKRMEETVGTAKYGELSQSLARIENIVLLSQGRPTSNLNILSDEEKEDLDHLFDENS